MNWGVFALFASLAIFFIIRMPISFSMLASWHARRAWAWSTPLSRAT